MLSLAPEHFSFSFLFQSCRGFFFVSIYFALQYFFDRKTSKGMKKSNEVSAFIWFEELLSKQRYLTGSCFHNSLLYVNEIQKRYAGCNGAYNLLNFIFVLFYFIRSVALENAICLEFHRQQCCIIFFAPALHTHIFIFMR